MTQLLLQNILRLYKWKSVSIKIETIFARNRYKVSHQVLLVNYKYMFD